MNHDMISDIKSRFGTAIRTRRKRLGLSQEELAGRAGLHRTYVADIERGARNLSLANIEKLALALDTTIPILFTPGDTPAIRGPEALPEILLVEDEPQDVEMVCRSFKAAGVRNQLHVVRDGVEALDFLFATGAYANRKNEGVPQFILLDLHLPKLNGLEVLKRLKSEPRTKNIQVIVLSASERNRDIEESKRLGADHYIVKPVDFQRFTQVLPQLELCWALLKCTS
jgi:CheY-like chemotaxis protein